MKSFNYRKVVSSRLVYYSILETFGQSTQEFAKSGVETVLMGKTCNFDSNLGDFNSVDLKKTKEIIKGQIFFQRPNLKNKHFKFYDFFTHWVILQSIIQEKS
jgi:hypothetical protein